MNLLVVILAAGLGTRMKSSLPKVLHTINKKPMVNYVIDESIRLNPKKIIVVINKHSEGIKEVLTDYKLEFAIQSGCKGTADALKEAIKKMRNFKGTVLVLNGDTPLIKEPILKKLLKIHKKSREQISIGSFYVKGIHSYGRILRKNNKVIDIVENRDANFEQKKINEVNSGMYAIESQLLYLLKEIKINKLKVEYYLTDIIAIAIKRGLTVGAHIIGDETKLTGINTQEDLYKAHIFLRDKKVCELMNNGVSFMDKDSVYIHPEVKIKRDTIIYPNVVIEGKSRIGSNCIIYPNSRIVDSNIGDGVVIKDSSVIETSVIKDNTQVGPFCHLRPNSIIGKWAKIGNFVEVKKSVIGEGTKASHLSYLGDATIGNAVNIGAGTITCNYDGNKKDKTIIEDNVFIGSDTQLIAPVRVGKGAYIGAGSTITKNVPPMALGISRVQQENISDWAKKKK